MAAAMTSVSADRAKGNERHEASRLSGKIVLDGRLQPALTSELFSVEDPAEESEVGNAPRCGAQDVNRAVESARIRVFFLASCTRSRTRQSVKAAGRCARSGRGKPGAAACTRNRQRTINSSASGNRRDARDVSLLCGRCQRDQGNHGAVVERDPMLHNARATGRCGSNHSLECAIVLDCGQARSGACCRQYRGYQGGRAGAFGGVAHAWKSCRIICRREWPTLFPVTERKLESLSLNTRMCERFRLRDLATSAK